MIHLLRRTQATLLVVLLLGAPLLHAQSPRGPVPVRVGLTPSTASSDNAVPTMPFPMQRESKWLEGGIAGAVVVGLLGLIAANAVDRDNDTPSSAITYVRVAAFSVAIGFSIGALIGAQFEK